MENLLKDFPYSIFNMNQNNEQFNQIGFHLYFTTIY